MDTSSQAPVTLSMTTFDQIDATIAARGIRNDVVDEVFFDGIRPLSPEDVIAIVGDMTLDELASYVDDKYDRRR
jgi:hypothetical protein